MRIIGKSPVETAYRIISQLPAGSRYELRADGRGWAWVVLELDGDALPTVRRLVELAKAGGWRFEDGRPR